jgi:hypothetical protein
MISYHFWFELMYEGVVICVVFVDSKKYKHQCDRS